jgi:hypothetical protein
VCQQRDVGFLALDESDDQRLTAVLDDLRRIRLLGAHSFAAKQRRQAGDDDIAVGHVLDVGFSLLADEFLHCRETTRWANSGPEQPQQILEANSRKWVRAIARPFRGKGFPNGCAPCREVHPDQVTATGRSSYR